MENILPYKRRHFEESKENLQEVRFTRQAYVGEITPFLSEEGKYEVYVQPYQDYYVVTVFKGRQNKPYARYRYNDMQKAGVAIDKFVDKIKKDYEAKDKWAQENKRRKQVVAENIKIGDIFYTSWGYDQTNVDMYQVIEKKPSSVVVREIALETVPGTEGFMSSDVRPIKDHFIGAPFVARVTPYGITGGDIVGSAGSAWLYDKGDKGTYTSSYA